MQIHRFKLLFAEMVADSDLFCGVSLVINGTAVRGRVQLDVNEATHNAYASNKQVWKITIPVSRWAVNRPIEVQSVLDIEAVGQIEFLAGKYVVTGVLSKHPNICFLVEKNY